MVHIEKNRIYEGECSKIMSCFPDEFVDLTVTSPPYDDLRTYEGYVFDFRSIAGQLWRVTKDGGIVVWIVGDATIDGSETGTSFRQALHFKDIGFRLHDTMIYQKAGFNYPDAVRYNPVFEYMFVFSKGKPKTLNFIKDKKNKYAGDKVARRRQGREKDGALTNNTAWRNDRDKRVKEFGKRNNKWRYKVGGSSTTNDGFAYSHPAIFPEALARDHIRSWSNPGDLVLDPMCGSGTVLKMAKETGRDWIGIDLSENYCELSAKRVKGAQPPLFT